MPHGVAKSKKRKLKWMFDLTEGGLCVNHKSPLTLQGFPRTDGSFQEAEEGSALPSFPTLQDVHQVLSKGEVERLGAGWQPLGSRW